MVKVLLAILCLCILSCKTKPDIIGKWEVFDELNRKYVSEFREDGTVITNHYDIETNTKLNREPLKLEYLIEDRDDKWHINFSYPNGQRKVSTPLEVINEDTLITFYKEVKYENKDSIISWEKVVHRRVY